MKRLMFVCAGIVIFASAMAMSTFEKTFEKHYSVKDGSNLDKAKCSVCHLKLTGGKLNPYGEDLKAAMAKAKVKKLNDEVIVSVESLDSNKNGKSNLDEIKADALPGAK